MIKKILFWYLWVLFFAALLSFSGGFLAQSIVMSSGLPDTDYRTGEILLGAARADYYWMYLLMVAVVIVAVITMTGRLPGLRKR
ncbi:MAG: hypothetical protein HKM98_02365 [Gammaproteobacteria bacterium]|nr:hypothetical protein [Gammaproteobacteria bacterium]